jgi:hypothetical protein
MHLPPPPRRPLRLGVLHARDVIPVQVRIRQVCDGDAPPLEVLVVEARMRSVQLGAVAQDEGLQQSFHFLSDSYFWQRVISKARVRPNDT